MKKICYVTTISLTIKSFFVPQLKYLSKHGFDVYVICSKDLDLQNELDESIHFIPIEIPRGISLLGMFSAILELKKIFDKEKFDLVQYSTPNASLCASISAYFSGIKVRNYHLMGFRYLGSEGFLKKILKLFEKITCKISTNIECVSKSNLEMGIRERIFTKDKACIVWNGSSGGVDLSRFNSDRRDEWRNSIRSKYGLNNKEVVFGFVGRITRDKGINEILEAFFDLRLGKLMLIGFIEDEESLDQELFSKSKRSENVIYAGFQSKIEEYFSAIDVLLLPSYREGFGNVIIEAGAVGTPSIISNIPGPIDAVIKNETAFVVEKKSSCQLCRAMIKIADKKILLKMKSNSVEFVKSKFDSDILCKYILDRKYELLN